jgi:hypothetical protein
MKFDVVSFVLVWYASEKEFNINDFKSERK